MRTAEKQWDLAGCQCDAYARLENEGIVFVNGKGGQCVMREEEWAAYQGKCLQGAPSVSMLEATTDEGEELDLLRRPRPSHFARAFNVMEALLLAHERSLDEEDREEMLRRLAGQMASLKTAVLRAEEIWHEEHSGAERLRIEHDHHVERANEAEGKVERLVFELQQERGGAA